MHHHLLALTCALTLPASALTVTTTADELDTPAGADISLREAIRDTPFGGTVDFSVFLDGEVIELTMGQLDILSTTRQIDASNLGQGITISGGGNSRILNIGSSTVTVTGVTFTQGSSPFNGGAIEAYSSSILTLTDCHLFDNEAPQSGGAISCALSNLTLNSTRITYNRAGAAAGGILIGGFSSNVTVNSSTISHNVAVTSSGAIHANGANSLTVRESTLSDNQTAGPGGAVYAEGTPSTFENTTIVANVAAAAGGGIYSNTAIALDSSTITGNTSNLNGGGVFLNSGAVQTISNTIVAENSAATNNDIGLNGASLTRSGANLIGDNTGSASVFPTGSPNANGDLVGDSSNKIDPLLSPPARFGGPTDTRHPLAGSPAIDAGGTTTLTTDQRGLGRSVGAATDIGAVETGLPLLVTTEVDENDPSLGSGAGDSLRECLTAAAGTGDHITFDPSLAGTSIVLTANQMVVNGKTVFVDASSLPNGITVNANYASRHLRVINLSSFAAHSVSFENGIRSGVSSSLGGAIDCQGGDLCLIKSSVSFNSAQGTNFSLGGAIHCSGFSNPASLTCIDCTFAMNTAITSPIISGAAIYFTLCPARLTGCLFDSNFATIPGSGTASGGAVTSSNAELIAENCHFSNNIASTESSAGGGAISSYGLVLIDACTFQNNHAMTNGGSGPADGGALKASPVVAAVYIRNSTFTGNTANDDGGAIDAQATLSISHSTFVNNTANNGNGGGIHAHNGVLGLENSILATNSVGTSGDDVFKGGSLTIIDDGGNFIGNNHTIATEFPAGPLVGTPVSPLDPLLQPIGNFGGPTPTRPPQPGSPVVDQGLPVNGDPATDQRGFSREVGVAPDIGAYETGNFAAGYPVWAVENIPAPLNATFTGNSENDLNQNGIEYACRLTPTIPDGSGVFAETLVPLGGGNYEVHFTFPYQPDAPDLYYFLRRNDNLQGPYGNRYRYNSSNGGELFHPSGNVTSIVDPIGKTITVIDAGVGTGPHHWRLEVELIP